MTRYRKKRRRKIKISQVWTIVIVAVLSVGAFGLAAAALAPRTPPSTSSSKLPEAQTATTAPECTPASLPRSADVYASAPSELRIAVLGDSTRDETARPAFYDALRRELPGAQITSFGSNGSSLDRYLDDQERQTAIRDAAPTLIELSIGINDLRLDQTNRDEFTALLTGYVETLRADLPDAEILLSVPASLSTQDVGGVGYLVGADGTVNPAGMAQRITDDLRSAYLSVAERVPGVVLLDVQTELTGTEADASPEPQYLSDQIHPDQEASAAIAGLVADQLRQRCSD